MIDFPNIVLTIILGGIAGFVAAKIVKGHGMGIGPNIFIGILGAILGSVVFAIFGGAGVTGFNLWSLLVSTLGAALLLYVFDRIK